MRVLGETRSGLRASCDAVVQGALLEPKVMSRGLSVGGSVFTILDKSTRYVLQFPIQVLHVVIPLRIGSFVLAAAATRSMGYHPIILKLTYEGQTNCQFLPATFVCRTLPLLDA